MLRGFIDRPLSQKVGPSDIHIPQHDTSLRRLLDLFVKIDIGQSKEPTLLQFLAEVFPVLRPVPYVGDQNRQTEQQAF